jgi:hypothetical protein
MKKILIAAGFALIVAAPLMAQSPPDPAGAAMTDMAAAQAQIDALKQQLERLQATVDYLKANASAERKDAAVAAVDVNTLKTNAARYAWSGDFRFRHEAIDVANDSLAAAHTRQRDRIRLRFGVLAKVNDSINAKLQLSSTNVGADSARSTNQTLGNGWDRKVLSIDQAYVDWKASDLLNLTLGKMPIPWVKTASYFWDNDLTPEGTALKFARGPLFAGVYYDWLNERNSSSSQAASTDATMAGVQVGFRQGFGKSTLTGAVAYFDINGVQDQIVKFSQTQVADPVTGVVTTTLCAIDPAFGGGALLGDNSFGNSTYTGAAPQVGSNTSCTRLLSDFNIVTALLQFDTMVGKYPLSVFADYMKNNAALANPTARKTLDSASAVGVTFNKASAAKSWEISALYEQNGKDAVFGQFVDSDFGNGATDANGWAFKGAWVPATSWTLNATLFLNKLNIEGVAPAPNPATATKRSLDYKRLQLDLNYKF